MLMCALHLLPPEDAHALTLTALKMGLGPTYIDKADLTLELFGKKIRNPIGLSGGADKEAAALAGWSKMGFGLVEAGTVTLRARTGNPRPRIWRMKNNSLVNWLGLPGSGLEPFVKNLAAFNSHPSRKYLCVGASIASPDNVLDEFKILAAAVAPYVDYITLNASCPNVEDHCVEDAKSDDRRSASLSERSLAASEQIESSAAQIRKAKEGAGPIPVLVKLGPTNDAKSLQRIVKAALNAGIDGFVATNTVPFASSALLKQKDFSWPQHDGKEVGGYSGGQLLDISCWMVSEIRKQVPKAMPIIGVGGIQSGQDAARMLKSGADAIQLYTGLVYKGPALIGEIAQRLAAK